MTTNDKHEMVLRAMIRAHVLRGHNVTHEWSKRAIIHETRTLIAFCDKRELQPLFVYITNAISYDGFPTQTTRAIVQRNDGLCRRAFTLGDVWQYDTNKPPKWHTLDTMRVTRYHVRV